VNAVQINVAASSATQKNMAYSAEGTVGEIDSAETARSAASADTQSVDHWTFFASADSSASAASSASSALAFATPRVEVENRCAAGECKLEIKNANNNSASTGNNAQTILNTVASVNAVQINVSGGAGVSQSNIAYSTLK
jgi:hypothetical protein